jgi:hypothetical protein
MKLHVESHHGSGLNPYHNIVINSTINICKVLNGTDNNPVAKWLIDMLSDALPVGLLHPCPYFGEFKMENVTLRTTLTALQFLKGTYTTIVRLFDKQDENIATLKAKSDFW